MPDGAALLYPMDRFYERAGLPLPSVHPVDGQEVPEPYRELLVHSHDMTPTLEGFHGERIHLDVRARVIEGDALWRQVLLLLDESLRPVEFGAIVIYLQRFPSPAREEVLEGRRPLGTILHDHRIEHRSQPLTFIRVAPDSTMADALQFSEALALYGRRNVIWNGEGKQLADIVEILPP
jgi:chorismate-pyruvate lyase